MKVIENRSTPTPAMFEMIKLIWRPAPHTARRVVGTLSRIDSSFSFAYDGNDLDAARSEGFRGYPGMNDFGKVYNGQAMSAFASRLPSRDRPDLHTLLGAWGAQVDMDDFQILGLTFGRLPTDMYEFVPVIEPVQGTKFFSDLAGIRNYARSEEFRHLPPMTELELRSSSCNTFDPCAVEVLHEGQQVAHIKRVHCESVAAAFGIGLKPTCVLQRVRLNGVIQEVIVLIQY